MELHIRRAQAADIPFLGWVMYTAARSHLETCPWSAILGEDEAGTRKLLEHVAQSPAAHWCHVSKFWIAEVDGAPAAAMSGFTPATEGTAVLAEAALGIAASVLGYSEARLGQVGERLLVATQGLPEDLPDVWGIENVAVRPEYRGKGLIDRLFQHALAEGRQKGFHRVQILCLIGNRRGQRAWERNGFAVLGERTSPDFDALIGTPGAKLMARDL
jgi:GNAT superfamily N-acetyltransferase